MVDVTNDDMKSFIKNKKSTRQPTNDISDDEIIQKTVRTMENESLRKAGIDPSEIGRNIDSVETLVGSEVQGANYYRITDLPSKFKFYSSNVQINARPLKVIEVKKLSALNDTNFNFIINDILSKAISGININKLFIADKIYLIFWLRANTYRDSGYTVNFTCPKCEKDSEFHFEIQNLETQYINDLYNPDKEITLFSGNKVKINFLRIEDESKISRFEEIQGQLLKDIDKELLSMACMLTEINGEKKNLLDSYYWMTTIDPEDFTYLNSYIEKYGMGVKPYMNVTCKKCGGVSPVGISFRSEFFLPTYNFE